MTFFGHAAAQLSQWWATTTATEMIWLGVGLLAQLMFSMRFIVQWIASERARRSIVPETFWYFSMVGGAMLFAYAIYRQHLLHPRPQPGHGPGGGRERRPAPGTAGRPRRLNGWSGHPY